MPDTDDRLTRHRPGSGSTSDGASPPPRTIKLPLPRLVAPSLKTTKNTLHLATWVEIKLTNDRGKPIAGERCVLFRADGVTVHAKTDADGVARFDGLPLLLADLRVRAEDVHAPAVCFPDILEEHEDDPPGDFGKNDGRRDDHRKHDGVVHFVRAEQPQAPVVIRALTEEGKFQHFRRAYEDNGARYDAAHPRDYSAKEARWNWGKGSVCNQHVNFFLGYWFNYNASFTTAGSATAMTCLPLYSSEKHTFTNGIKHRGYLELLTPLNGYGTAVGARYDPADPSVIPDPSRYSSAYKHVEYVRMSRYFDRSTGRPNDDGRKLVDDLADYNVYSLSDIKKDDREKALSATRAWMKKHAEALGLTAAQIGAKTEQALWDVIWDLDDDDEDDAELVASLRKMLNWDHHAGILLKRAKGGGPRTGAAGEEIELWTFSADGATTPGPKIVMKKYEEVVKGSKFQHLAIWKLKPLRPGGFAPAVDNAGKIDVDAPPRFIHWG